MAYSMGFSAVWAVVGYTLVEFFLFLYYAPRIRKFSGDHDCITLPDFYAARFNDKSGTLRILIIIIFLVFMVTYVSAQFVGGGKAFFTNFELDQTWGIILTAAIVLVYYYPWRIYGSEPDGCITGLCHAGSVDRIAALCCYPYGRLERDKHTGPPI